MGRAPGAGRTPYGCVWWPSRTAHRRSDRVFGYRTSGAPPMGRRCGPTSPFPALLTLLGRWRGSDARRRSYALWLRRVSEQDRPQAVRPGVWLLGTAARPRAASRPDKLFPAPPSSGRRRGSSALRRLRRPAPSWSREGARPEEPETWLFWFVGFGGCRLHLGHTCASGGARKRGAPTGAPLGKGVPDRIAEG